MSDAAVALVLLIALRAAMVDVEEGAASQLAEASTLRSRLQAQKSVFQMDVLGDEHRFTRREKPSLYEARPMLYTIIL